MSTTKHFDPPFFVKIILLFALIAIGSFKNKVINSNSVAKKDSHTTYSKYEFKSTPDVTTLDTKSASFTYDKD